MQKIKLFTIALTLTLIFSAAISITYAHDPPWNISTYSYISISPPTAGVNQQIIIYMWLDKVPPTASGAYGDRWEGMTVTVNKPDGTTHTLGPFTSDPIGFSWGFYVPTEVGTYSLQMNFPGQTVEGNNLDPNDFTGRDFIGDYYEPSTSDPVELTVVEDPVPTFPDTPLPTDYWTRPIDAQHREWWPISGNWLAPPDNNFARYVLGPETSHILWANELTFGGLVGGEYTENAYHCGNAYEGKFTPPVIINGRLYYNKYPTDIYAGFPGGYPRDPPKNGVACVDLRTGEEIWYNPDYRIDLGQILQFDSPNQHGSVAYLWQIVGGFFSATWNAYDAFTGDWVYSITDAPPGLTGMFGSPWTFGEDGSILVPQINTQGNYMTLWNSSAIPELLGGPTGTANWQWRPYGKTVNGTKGYSWNVTIPTDLEGSINYVFPDRVIGSTGFGSPFSAAYTEEFTVWALSLEPGREGQLLWKKTHSGSGETIINLGSASVEDGVFVTWTVQTRQWTGYSIETGDKLWGPTESQSAWDYTVGTTSDIAYGKLFSAGWSGKLYCYDVATGEHLWTWEASDPYFAEAKWEGNYPIDIWFIADEKIYVGAGEHSPDDPKERGAPTACVDVNTGEELWKIPFYSSHWSYNPAIADSIITFMNAYDNRIYAFGKGPSATTVKIAPGAIVHGSSVVIEGTVTDQSAGAKDTPAISDDDMDEWMKYLYMQFPIPADATGVTVTLDTLDPNGNFVHIGEATSDMSGTFGFAWTPDIPGLHKVIATFAGSESYASSYAVTYLNVEQAPEPDPTPTPTPAPMTDTYVMGFGIAAIVAIVVIGAIIILMIRKK